MKPPKSRKADLGSNATGGEKPHAETAESAEFKMTELGPIPVDWEVKRINQCGDVVTGSTPPRGNSELWGGSFNWISAKDFKGKYIISSDEKVTEAGKRYCRALPTNSVLVTCIASIGLNAIAKRPCATNQQINAVVCRDCDYEYFYYQCCFNESRLRQMAGQTAVPIIGKSQFEGFNIVLPKEINEQRRIAGALSDVDELISALGKLIEKKRNIKTGAMQELLTGKTRLSGFGNPETQSLCASVLKKDTEFEDLDFNTETQRHEVTEFKMTELGPIPKDWEVKRLGEIGESIRGVSFGPEQSSLTLMPNATMLLRANNIQNNQIVCQDVVYVVNECIADSQQLEKGDILICAANGSRNLVGKAAAWRRTEAATFGAFMAVFRCAQSVDSCFVEYLLQSRSYRRQLDDILTGSAINNLNARDIEGLAFAFPTLAEQKAIAAVLSDMDAEIAALEADRAKYERIKSGMMQELLTGKTRLKP